MKEEELAFVKNQVRMLFNIVKPNYYLPMFQLILHGHTCIICKVLWNEQIFWVLLDENSKLILENPLSLLTCQ